MTSNNSKQKQIREEIAKEIDFLSDHWVNDDDKPPFTFGGWREEVLDTIMAIFAREQERILKKGNVFCGHVLFNIQMGVADENMRDQLTKVVKAYYKDFTDDLTTQLPEEKEA